jgi:alanine racemase
VTSAPATLGLVPLGYHEGIPRSGRNTAPVFIRGNRFTISGTVCMNQCVIDTGEVPVEAGDEVTLFGPGDHGEPTAQEWADLLDTLSYDIVTRFTGKIPRSYCGVTEAEAIAVQTALVGESVEAALAGTVIEPDLAGSEGMADGLEV